MNNQPIIRSSEASDIPAIKAIYEEPSCYAATLQLPYPSEANWQKRIGNVPDNVHSLVAELNNQVVANLGMEVAKSPRMKHVARFGMGVSESVQGQGIGSQLLQAAIDLAFNWLAIRRMELTVYVDNERAIGLYKKHGFEVEGTLKSYAFRNGEYVDAYTMALIRN